MKGRILSILRQSEAMVALERLSTDLEIPVVSLEKEIQQLRELGYEIDSAPGGYRLGRSPDIPFPWEFPGRESHIHYFDEVSSTMDIARDLARQDCPHLTVVIAGRQAKGRGRLKRTWLSAEGGLFFNMVLRPPIPPSLSYKVNFIASLVLSRTLQNLYGINARVKWPNDVLVDGKKISGILAEMEADADRVSYINIGIGINVNNDPTSVELKATSVRKVLNRTVSRRDLLSEFLDAFEKRLDRIVSDDVISEWKQETITLNQKVQIVTTQGVSEGIAIDVTDTGALLLQQADGTIKTVVYGDCFLV